MIKVNDKEIEWYEGMTIACALKEAGDSYPYVVVRVGEKSYSRHDFQKVVLEDGIELFPIPMIAGG